MKDRLKAYFEANDIKKLETPRFKLSVGNVGGKLGMEQLWDSAEDLPEAYRIETVVIKADTEKIREELESGMQLPFAELKQRGTSLRIK